MLSFSTRRYVRIQCALAAFARCRAIMFVAIVIGACHSASPAVAVNPSLSGSIVLHFALSPDNPETPQNESFWYFDGHTSAICAKPARSARYYDGQHGQFELVRSSELDAFPLDTGQLFISHTGSGELHRRDQQRQSESQRAPRRRTDRE